MLPLMVGKAWSREGPNIDVAPTLGEAHSGDQTGPGPVEKN
jgi:hypothetical protein